MDAAGLLPERPELVDGRILAMPAVGDAHMVSRHDFSLALTPAWRPPRFLASQDTVRFAGGWCPMPDFALLDEYPKKGAEVDPLPRLVIEVADSTLDYDLGDKRRRYARAGVPEYAVAALPRRELVVLRGPDGDGWREEATLRPGDAYSPLCLPELTIDVAAVLPAASFDADV